MDKKFLKEQKEKLEEEKKKLEKQLASFARKNKKISGDWITKYPDLGSGSLEEEADEVEEYGNILSVSYTLEKELKKVVGALARIQKGTYGKCIECGKPISKGRMEAYPQAEKCIRCANKR